MATVPVTRTWVAGEVVTAAYMNNNITAVLGWLLAPALCQVRQITTAQNFTTATFTAVTYNAEDVDTTGMHSTVSNTSRFTAVYPGWYDHSGATSFSANASGRRGGNWRVNNTDVNGSAIFLPGQNAALVVPNSDLLIYLNVGDYSEYFAFQDSGSTLSTSVVTYSQSRASVRWRSN